MASTQKCCTLRAKPRQGGKQCRHTKEYIEKRSHRVAQHGFLKHAFVPVISQQLASLGHPSQIEGEFFNSLSHFAALYGFNLPDYSVADYPLNIAQAFEWAVQQMKRLRLELVLILVKDATYKCCIATVKIFDTGACLYYIPVKPLHLLLNDRKAKPQAGLLLSIFGYLYQIAQIPYFTEGYLSDTYDMIYNWITEDPNAFDEEDHLYILEEFKEMEYTGRRLFKSIRHPYHVQQFENRVQRFKPAIANDEALLAIGTKLLYLYKQHPTRTVFDSINESLLDPGAEEQIMPHQYISFFWSGKGPAYQQVIETVNMNFQEIACMQEPLTVQLFNTLQKEEKHNLDFEQQLFECLYELNEYLNET